MDREKEREREKVSEREREKYKKAEDCFQKTFILNNYSDVIYKSDSQCEALGPQVAGEIYKMSLELAGFLEANDLLTKKYDLLQIEKEETRNGNQVWKLTSR